MKPQIATSREQSERLLKCGVDPETADMAWTHFESDGEKYVKLDVMDEYAYEFASLHPVPAWSLAALMELLPKGVCDKESNEPYYFCLAQDYPLRSDYSVAYIFAWGECDDLFRVADESPIEACVKAIEWLSENGYKLNEI